MGKRAYYIEITKENDGSVLWLDNLDNRDYNADIDMRYESGIRLMTSDSTETTVVVFDITQGIVARVMNASGAEGMVQTALPQEIIDKINDVGFWSSIPLWTVTLLGGLFIAVLSFVMIMPVYSRMFWLYFYAALAPIPLATFAGEPTSNVGHSFVKSYAGVCLEGAGIALACIIFSAMASAPPAVDSSVSAVTAV